MRFSIAKKTACPSCGKNILVHRRATGEVVGYGLFIKRYGVFLCALVFITWLIMDFGLGIPGLTAKAAGYWVVMMAILPVAIWQSLLYYWPKSTYILCQQCGYSGMKATRSIASRKPKMKKRLRSL